MFSEVLGHIDSSNASNTSLNASKEYESLHSYKISSHTMFFASFIKSIMDTKIFYSKSTINTMIDIPFTNNTLTD